MKAIYSLLIVIFSSFFLSAKIQLQDDSIKYVTVGNINLPNESCANGWAAMLNSSGQSGGPNKKIRVYYNFNNQPRVCETTPLPNIPDPKQIYTLLGCWGGKYEITSSEYIK